MADRITDPIDVPASLMAAAGHPRRPALADIAAGFHLLRKYSGASQTRLGIVCGLTQGKVSAIMAGSPSGDRPGGVRADRRRAGHALRGRSAFGLAPRSAQPGYPVPGWSRAATLLACA